MADSDGEKIKKLKRGELIGTVATAFCGAVLVYFIVCFAVGAYTDNGALKISTLIVAPVLTVAAAGVAAFCNLTYGAELDRLIKERVLKVFVENAALMHPERDSLTFYCTAGDAVTEIKVNNFKEKIVFDFSDFGKLSLARKATIASAIETRLCLSFVRLVSERGAKYSSVNYLPRTAKKQKKPTYIIKDGTPDKRAVKIYLRNK